MPLLEANIPLERALALLGDEPDNPQLQQLVGDLRRGLHEGRRLSDLIRDQSRVFPPVYAGVVAAGEEAGALPQVMAQLRLFLTSASELRSFIISSSVYPAFIAVAGIAMLGFVLCVIVPKFATSLAGAGVMWQYRRCPFHRPDGPRVAISVDYYTRYRARAYGPPDILR